MKATKRTDEPICLHPKLISKKWAEQTKRVFIVIQKMKERQQNLSLEVVYKGAMEQVEKKLEINNKTLF